jgi:hypothetical protein
MLPMRCPRPTAPALSDSKHPQEEEADLRVLMMAKQQEKEDAYDSMTTKGAEVDTLMAAKHAEAEAEDDAAGVPHAAKGVLMTAAQWAAMATGAATANRAAGDVSTPPTYRATTSGLKPQYPAPEDKVP